MNLNKIDNIVKKHTLLQHLLKQRRYKFCYKCISDNLYKNYIRNRYFHEEYRSEFEIGRIWDEITFELIEKLIEESNHRSGLRGAILQVLTERCKEVSCVLNSFDLEHEQHLLEESLNVIKTRYEKRISLQNQLVDKYIKGKKDREFFFMELMINMMDTAEKLSKNR